MPRFQDIPQFPRSGYRITVDWTYLEQHLEQQDPVINLEPDYQRGHVWTKSQRVAFVEYGLMGGESGMNILTNCPGWMGDFRGPYEVVDGLQRITSVRMFLNNEIKAFGHYKKEYTDKMRGLGGTCFHWQVFSLPTRAGVLNLYLLHNAGGVVHSPKEIARVRALLEAEKK